MALSAPVCADENRKLSYPIESKADANTELDKSKAGRMRRLAEKIAENPDISDKARVLRYFNETAEYGQIVSVYLSFEGCHYGVIVRNFNEATPEIPTEWGGTKPQKPDSFEVAPSPSCGSDSAIVKRAIVDEGLDGNANLGTNEELDRAVRILSQIYQIE